MTDENESNKSYLFLIYENITVVRLFILFIILFGIGMYSFTGVWPPFAYIESGSMEPNLNQNDLVVVESVPNPDYDIQSERDLYNETGIVTYTHGKSIGYKSESRYGDIILFESDSSNSQVIHRAMYWVNEGDDWIEMYSDSDVDCEQIHNCPADRDGIITKGDNNDRYDQKRGNEIVELDDINSKVHSSYRYLGWPRIFTPF